MVKRWLWLMMGFCMATLLSVQAEQLLADGNAEHGPGKWSGVEVQPGGAGDGQNCFVLSAPDGQTAVYEEFLEIDPALEYKLSCRLQDPDAAPGRVLVGFIPFDANKQQIRAGEVNVVAGTETELAAPCHPGDTILMVKDASKWSSNPAAFVAFEVDDSGHYADLPNRAITGTPGISAVRKNGEVWEIVLDQPCGKEYPVGTKVREHRDYNTYIYPIDASLKANSGWRRFSTVINGLASNAAATDQFWPGTKFVKVMIYKLGEFKLLADDIALEVSAGAQNDQDFFNGSFERWHQADPAPGDWEVSGNLLPDQWRIENRPDARGRIARLVNANTGDTTGKYSLLLDGSLISEYMFKRVAGKKIQVALRAKGTGGRVEVRLREFRDSGDEPMIDHNMVVQDTKTGSDWNTYTGSADMPTLPTWVETNTFVVELIGHDVAVDDVAITVLDGTAPFTPIRFEIPYAAGIVTDGSFTMDEWARSSGADYGMRNAGGNLSQKQCEYRVATDRENLLISLRTPFTDPLVTAERNRDGKVWEDDSYEIHITPNPGVPRPDVAYQFAVNAFGTIYDSRNDLGAKWNCAGIRAVSNCKDGMWTLELSIPLKEIGVTPGADFAMNFCRNVKNPQGYCSLSGFGYFEYDKMPLWQIRDDAVAVFWGNRNSNRRAIPELFAVVTNTGTQPVSCDVTFDVAADQLAAKEKTALTLPASATGNATYTAPHSPGATGQIGIDVEDPASHRLIASQHVDFDTSAAPSATAENTIIHYPLQHKIGVTVSGSQRDRAAAATLEMSGKDMPPELQRSENIEQGYNGAPQIRFDFPASEAGDYLVVATIFDRKGNAIGRNSAMVTVTKPPVWLDSTLGKDGTVVAPFTPIETDGGKLSCWGRTYTIGGNGFPSEIISQGQSVLTAPVALAQNRNGQLEHGQSGTLRILESHPDFVRFTGETVFPDCTVTAEGRLEYDGTLLYDITLRPTPNQPEVTDLELEIPFRDLKYLHTQNLWMSRHPADGEYCDTTVPVWTPDYDYIPAGAREYNGLYFPKGDGLIWSSRIQTQPIFYLTFGNTEYGISYFCDSERGWYRDYAKPAIETYRQGDSSTVRFNLISKPLPNKEERHIRLAFAATPIRQKKVGFNYLNWWPVGFGESSHIKRGLGGLEPTDAFVLNNFLNTASPDKNIPILFYNAKAYMVMGDPVSQYYVGEWRTEPGGLYDFRSMLPVKRYGVDPDNYFAPAGCLVPSRVDYMVAGVDALMTNVPRLAGMYWDESYTVPCSNVFHADCGFRTEDGTVQSDSHYFGMRELDKRTQTVLQKHQRPFPNMLDHSTEMIPAVYAFTDINLCAERGTKDLDFIDYWDLPRIENTAAGAWGINVMWIPQWEQVATKGGPNTLANNRSMLAALKLFDLNIWDAMWCMRDVVGKFREIENSFGIAADDSKFFGYWQPENRSAVSGMPVFIKASFFVRPGKGVLLYVSNLSKTEQKVSLQLDFRAWQLDSWAVTDAETGQPIPAAGNLVDLTIGGHDFRNLWITPKP